jgi:hypothetical protein
MRYWAIEPKILNLEFGTFLNFTKHTPNPSEEGNLLGANNNIE